MTEIGSFEAKNKLSELLARAEKGEEIVITRRGRPVARLTGFDARRERSRDAPRRMRERAREVANDIRSLADEMRLGAFDWEEWKRYRDEGRR